MMGDRFHMLFARRILRVGMVLLLFFPVLPLLRGDESLPAAAAIAHPLNASPTPPVVVGKIASSTADTAGPTRILYDGPETEAVKDLRQVLAHFPAGEIVLESVPLEQRTGQQFYLERTNGKTLIKYTVTTSLENAIYTLLDRWGFRWYGPGENWFVQPTAIPPNDIPGRWITPSFRNRSFSGTGGLDFPAPTPRAFDPANRFKSEWYAWKRRNRFNADFQGAGHAGDEFYLENKQVLDGRPEWFNSESGKQGGRIRIEIPEAVATYKAWAKRKYPQEPPAPSSRSV